MVGSLLSNVWSIGHDSGADRVNSFSWQPFVNYNFDGGWYLTSSPLITANWEADSGDIWTLPVGGGIGKVFKIGGQAINTKLSYYYNVETPLVGPDQQIQLQFTLLFPTS